MNNRRILFVSEATQASPTRYRALAYFDLLRAAGWQPRHIAVTGLRRRLAVLAAARSADVIVILRKMFTPAFCRLLRGTRRRLILDIDDALFFREDGTTSPAISQHFAAMSASVDAVWAGNDFLAQHAARHCKDVTVLPTSIDPARYPDVVPSPNSATFDLVWIGSSSTRKYLESLLPILTQAAKEIPTLRLKIIADFDLPAFRAAGIQTIAISWEANTEAAELASAHVGLAPLPDDPWTRGKCGLKILQYMAAHLPVIASPVAVQTTIVQHEATGFIAPDQNAWLSALRRLHSNPALRHTLAAAGRRRAIDHYAIPVTFDKMLASLSNLAAQ